MVHSIPFAMSDAMRRENAAQRELTAHWTIEYVRATFPDRESYYRRFLEGAEGKQLHRLLPGLPPGSRILDIGAGYGHIAVYLASQGYRVSVAEVSPELCSLIAQVAKLYELSIDVYHVSAESLDKLQETGFDACMFNASLHHCDDPVRALANAHDLLRPGGQLFLLNEPVLQVFRSKQWFNRQLAEGKLVTGDYGGNEHTYYYGEYRSMLRRVGFKRIRDFIAYRYVHPHRYLGVLSIVRASRISILLRTIWYSGIGAICRLGFVGIPALFVLKRLSLLQTDFVATKGRSAN